MTTFHLVNRPAVLIRRTCTPLDYCCSLLTLAVRIGPGVERVLQDRDDTAIADRHPFNAHQLLAIGGAWKVHLFSGQRQQYLACATVLTEARKDHADCFLHPQVRIKTQTNLTMPDVADRHADTQLTALSLAVFSRACENESRRVRTRLCCLSYRAADDRSDDTGHTGSASITCA